MPRSVFTQSYKSLLEVLVDMRKASGVTQVELAKRLGKPQPWVSLYERGVRRIDVIEFVAIAKALGVKPEKMFERVLAKMPKQIEI
ncbi:MAG: helix-turn-helix transcriptional regulator [Hyphomonadaceae bacterium]